MKTLRQMFLQQPNVVRGTLLTETELSAFDLAIERGTLDAEELSKAWKITAQSAREHLKELYRKGYADRQQMPGPYKRGKTIYIYTPKPELVEAYQNPLGVPKLEQLLAELSPTQE